MQEFNKIRFRKVLAHRVIYNPDNESESSKVIYKILISSPQISFRWVDSTKLNQLIRDDYHSNYSYEYIDVETQTDTSDKEIVPSDRPSYSLPKPILVTIKDVSNNIQSFFSNFPFPTSIISIDSQNQTARVKYDSGRDGTLPLQNIKLLYPKLLAEYLLANADQNEQSAFE